MATTTESPLIQSTPCCFEPGEHLAPFGAPVCGATATVWQIGWQWAAQPRTLRVTCRRSPEHEGRHIDGHHIPPVFNAAWARETDQ